MTHAVHMESATQLTHVAALQVRVKSTVSVARTTECATATVKDLNVEIEYKSMSPGGVDYLGPIPGRPRASSRSSGSSSAACSRVASTRAQSRRKSGQNGSVTTDSAHTLFIPWLLLVMSWRSGGHGGTWGGQVSYGGVRAAVFRIYGFRGKPAGRRRDRRATTNQVTAGRELV